ncbi:MAG: hypothetical protein B7Z66_09360 [Chromatiales bacterium 21-64-14]|nr:MAG: hypothetical protein B7Z66_09360 [Chromatiales bacterium 21-64-14]HQU16185.1 DUF1003 domain-containing protein [Gammaproteobacteria bacterium]
MRFVRFPNPYQHKHSKVRNVNEVLEQRSTFGQRTADRVAAVMGSWNFIIVQSVLLTAWIILNVTAYLNHWDPYPFILMNLVLSMQAAYAAPIIMMSQNRQAQRDRVEAQNDYQVNIKSEEEIRAVLDHLAAQDQALAQMQKFLVDHFNSGQYDPLSQNGDGGNI